MKHLIIPVWFFVGLLLGVYGILILASGIAEWSSPPTTQLANLHAEVWWGAIMTVVGLFYVLSFRPHHRQID